MNAIIQIQIGNRNCSGSRHCNFCIAQLAVHIQLYRITIQTGSIGLGSVLVSLSHQCNGVGHNGLTRNFHAVGILIGNGHAGEVGVLTVNGCIRIVDRKIVNVIRDILIVVVVALTCGVMAVDLDIIQELVRI